MMVILLSFLVLLSLNHVYGFWDTGTTTIRGEREDTTPRISFFRWQWVYNNKYKFWFWYWDWEEIERRRRLNVIAGISIDMIPLSTAVLLNRRTLVSAYNYLDQYINRQRDLRIWALGRSGSHVTPYRYRVWSVHRLIPWSMNPEHCHGARCIHQPRHDVCIIHSHDQIYIYDTPPFRLHFAYRSFLVKTRYQTLDPKTDTWFAGSGYEYMEHIEQNYKIFFYAFKTLDSIIDCSHVLPKWWGKFICIKNEMNFAGLQNGGGLFNADHIFGVGCFEIRYNEERIYAFTDLRYYHTLIYNYAHLYPGQYYEYAYPQWGVHMDWVSEVDENDPRIPQFQIQYDLYPLG